MSQNAKKVAGEAAGRQPKIFGSAPNAPVVFGTTSASSGFDFRASTDERDNALARLAKKESELDEAKKNYHDILVERDSRIEELEKTLKNIRAEFSGVRREKDELAREVQGYKDSASSATAAKKKIEEDLKFQKGIADYDREMAEKLRKESIDSDKRIKTAEQLVRQLKDQVSTDAATLKELHAQVDDLEAQKDNLQTANSNLALQYEGNTNEVSHATKEFEQMFKDLGRELDLNGYVTHVRDLLSSGQLKRQDSSLSLQRQLSPQKSYQELTPVTGTSLQEQLAAADDASSERSIRNDDAEDDEDDTIRSLGLGRTWTEYDYFVHLQDQEKKITELKRQNEELLLKIKAVDTAKVNSDSATQTDTVQVATPAPQTFGFSGIQAIDTAPIKADPVTQNLTFSGVQSVDTKSIEAQPTTQNLSFSGVQSINTEPIKPQPKKSIFSFSGIRSSDTDPDKLPFVPNHSKQWKAKLDEERKNRPLKQSLSDVFSDDGTKPDHDLSIKLYPGVEIKPRRPITRQAIKLIPTGPPSLNELWQRLPFWYKLIFFMLISLYLVLFAGVVSERYVWLSANELTQQHVVNLGNGALSSVFAPINVAFDTLVGTNNNLMG